MGSSPLGERLDLRLIAAHPELSRRKAREVIEKGQVTVDGDLAREPGAMVAAAAAIVWDVNRKAMSRARLSLERLYEDDTLIVVDKPAGLLSVPSAPDQEGEDTARARVFDYAAKLHPRRPYVGAVHRLDRDTSGALAFALHPAAREALRELFGRHAIVRRYLAIVSLSEGSPAPPSRETMELAGAANPPAIPRLGAASPPAAGGVDRGVIDLPIHTEYVAGRRRVARPGEPSLPARTRWRLLERFSDAALLELELETGRQHQIRLHLAQVGMPVLGDLVYGAKRGGGRGPRRLEADRQMLHAWWLELTHPLTGVKVRAESPLPPDFRVLLDQLRRQGAPKGGGGSAGRPQPKKR